MRVEPDVDAVRLQAIRAPFLAAGAEPAHAAVLQPLALLLDLTGEALRSQLFVVQAEAREEMALRPDFTIPIALDHIADGAADGVFRYDGKVFLAAAPGSDEPDEFLQIGLERFESGAPAPADAEVMALAWRSASAGGRSDLSLIMGDVDLFVGFLSSFDFSAPVAARLKRALGRPRRLRAELDGQPVAVDEPSRLAALLAGLPESEGVKVLQDLWSLSGITPTGGRPAAEIVHRLAERAQSGPALTPAQADPIRQYLAISGAPEAAFAAITDLAGPVRGRLDLALNGWRHRLAALGSAGVPADRMTFSAGFGRPFGYYDGLMFEVCAEALGDARPVAAGGRYDGLMTRLGGSGGAVGCMVRPARAAAEHGQ